MTHDKNKTCNNNTTCDNNKTYDKKNYDEKIADEKIADDKIDEKIYDEKTITDFIRRISVANCNIDEYYYKIAKRLGYKQSEFNLMCSLMYDEVCTQKRIIEEWLIPKTTLNTITKQWEAAGYITLHPVPGKRREMQLCLTPSGQQYIDRCLKPISRAEHIAMRKTLNRFSPECIAAIEYFSSVLQTELEISCNNTENNNQNNNDKNIIKGEASDR